MSRFNVGDRVRLTGPEWGYIGEGWIGKVVTVTGEDSDGDATFPSLDDDDEDYAITENDISFAGELYDTINHPSHYTAYKGIEVIQLTEQLNFNRGNAVKYVARAGLKNKDTELEDLKKAAWYLQREIERISNA